MVRSSVDDADVRSRLVVARVGWCTAYHGDPADPPHAGGSFNKTDVGSEHHNFRSYRGLYYGYAQPVGALSLSRVTGDERIGARSDKGWVDDVCVAMIAKSPEYGQVLIGWYRHATLYAEQQEHSQRGLYQWVSKASEAVLLPPDWRTTVVPAGKDATGQSNVTYARGVDRKILNRSYLAAIRRAILDWKQSEAMKSDVASNEDAIVRGQGFQKDARYRSEIEAHSMRVVRRALKRTYRSVKDVSREQSYDYLCVSKIGRRCKVEVKGTTTRGESVLFLGVSSSWRKSNPSICMY